MFDPIKQFGTESKEPEQLELPLEAPVSPDKVVEDLEDTDDDEDEDDDLDDEDETSFDEDETPKDDDE